MKVAYPLFLMLTLAAAPALAGPKPAEEGARPINEHRPLKADAKVSVSNVAGMIEVLAWDKNELELTGQLGEDVEKLEITGSDSSLSIEVKLPRSLRNIEGDTLLKLRVPAGITLNAESVSADVSVRGLRGAIDVESVSGDVHLEVASAKIKTETVSGDVNVKAPAADTRAHSVSGDLVLEGLKGEVSGESVSGNIRLTGREFKALDLQTVSGDIELSVELAKNAKVEVETLSGDVTLALPALPDGEIDMETFSGDLGASWPLDIDDDEKDFHRDGKGDGRVRLHSFSGDIRINKR